jgi:carbamoylphosphate synthase small subunit
MKFGHHGGNHPVKDIDNNVVMITAQNHGLRWMRRLCRPTCA